MGEVLFVVKKMGDGKLTSLVQPRPTKYFSNVGIFVGTFLSVSN